MQTSDLPRVRLRALSRVRARAMTRAQWSAVAGFVVWFWLLVAFVVVRALGFVSTPWPIRAGAAVVAARGAGRVAPGSRGCAAFPRRVVTRSP